MLELKNCKFCFNVCVCTHFQTAASVERTSGHDFIVGHVYRGVETLGKELFMYFDEKALR